jgi:hypothetical protein
MIMTPHSQVLNKSLREHSHILNCSTIVSLGDWDASSLLMSVEGVFEHSFVPTSAEEAHLAATKLEVPNEIEIKEQMILIYQDVKELVKHLFVTQK